MSIKFGRKNGMKLFWYLITFTKFYRNFRINLSFCNTRKENTVLNRLHVGHSYLTHSFILRKEEAPVCVACGAVVTVKHILIECADLLEIRKKYFEEKSLYSLFWNMILEIMLISCERLVCYTKHEVCKGNVFVKCF